MPIMSGREKCFVKRAVKWTEHAPNEHYASEMHTLTFVHIDEFGESAAQEYIGAIVMDSPTEGRKEYVHYGPEILYAIDLTDYSLEDAKAAVETAIILAGVR